MALCTPLYAAYTDCGLQEGAMCLADADVERGHDVVDQVSDPEIGEVAPVLKCPANLDVADDHAAKPERS